MKTIEITDGLRRACVELTSSEQTDDDFRRVVRALAYAVLNSPSGEATEKAETGLSRKAGG
jgi:hypothetical protein